MLYEVITIPEEYNKYFKVKESTIFDVKIPFTIDSWNGRIKACRGVGASLSNTEITNFEQEHLAMLKNGTDNFNILHYCAITILEKNNDIA